MEPLSHEQVLAIIGDQELELRQLRSYAGQLERQVQALQAELDERRAADGEQPEPVRSTA